MILKNLTTTKASIVCLAFVFFQMYSGVSWRESKAKHGATPGESTDVWAERESTFINDSADTESRKNVLAPAVLFPSGTSLPPSSFFEAPIPMARILNIVADGEEKLDPLSLEQIKVLRAQDDPTQAPTTFSALPGMDLFALDEVVTGPNVNVTIIFLPNPNEDEQVEEYREVVLDQNSSLRIANPEWYKYRLLFGRGVSTCRGRINAVTGALVALVTQTQFELSITNEGDTELIVLEGAVTLKTGDQEEAPPAGEASVDYWRNWENFKVPQNQISDTRRVIMLDHACDGPRSFRIATPTDLDWVTVEVRPDASIMTAEKNVVKIPSRQQVYVPVRMTLNTSEVKPNSYDTVLSIECINCDDTCKGVIPSPPVHIDVTPGETVDVKEDEEILVAKSRPLPTPSPASADKKLNAVELQIKVYEATVLKNNPYVTVPGSIPTFESTQDRNTKFRDYSRKAVTGTQTEKAEAYEKLGDVYRSVGDNRKADKAYIKVEEKTPAKASDQDFQRKRLETKSGLGKLSAFDPLLLQVKSDIDRSTDSRTFALSHIALAIAELNNVKSSLKPGNTSVLAAAQNAALYFEHVRSRGRSALKTLKPAEKSAFWTNYGMALRMLGNYWLGEGDATKAKKYFADARKAFENARVSDMANPYVASNLGLVLTGLGNTEKFVSGSASAKARNYYTKALKEINNADSKLGDTQTARLVLEASEGKSITPFSRYSQTQTAVIPDLRGRLKEVAVEMLARAGYLPKFVETPETSKTRQCIRSQEPVAGNFLKRGEVVRLWLEDCPAKTR